MSAKEYHLGLIQSIVSRMGNNSFLIKGWCSTLVSAILVFATDKGNRSIMLVCFIPTVLFWILDAYYLYKEQLYRDKYDQVRMEPEPSIDYSLEIIPNSGGRTWVKAYFSRTLLIFYGGLIITIAIVMWMIPIHHLIK